MAGRRQDLTGQALPRWIAAPSQGRLGRPIDKGWFGMRVFVVCLVLLLPGLAAAADRVALVVGMAQYRTVVPLKNTLNDARGISAALAGIGFNVTTVLDAGGDELRTALDEFAFRSETADLALIYFAGHGVEVQGENFLIPVDADVQSNRDIQRQAVSLRELLSTVDRARRMRIVILDSCRDNPFGDLLDAEALTETAAAAATTRSAGGGGLAPPSPDRGTLVAYAARDGERALDGDGDNSPFALALMNAIAEPGLEISLMFRQVRDEVLRATGDLQEPHTYGSLSGTPFYLAGTGPGDAVTYDADPRVAWANLRPDQETRHRGLAEVGETRSMLALGYIRLNSSDPRYDPAEAFTWFSRAAEAGSAEAIYELGKLHEEGLGTAQDVGRALELYHRAAEMDFADALNDLGFLYFQGGAGVPRDPERAIGFFTRAAAERHPQAMYNMAALIDDGMVPGRGPEDAGLLLYQALRSGAADVYEQLQTRPEMFKPETRRALQQRLAANGFYEGAIDGSIGPGTQRGIRAAYGIVN
jgi:TPR repeat protein